MDEVLGKHLQTANIGLQKPLHKEWYFIQRVTPGIEIAFRTVEDALHDAFILALFKGVISQIPGRVVTGMPVKQAGIFFPDTTQTAGANWTASSVFTGHLVVAIR